MQIHQLLQPVVAVDNATIEVVQIRRSKSSAIQWNQRAQLGWNYRQYVEDHPLRLVAALAESFHHFQPLGILQALLQRSLVLHLLAQFDGQAINFNALEKFLDRFRAHHRLEAGGAVLLIELAILYFILDNFALFNRRVARIDDHVGLEVEDRFQVAQGNIEQMPDAARQSLEEPHVRTGRGELDVAETLAAHFGESYFDAALVADHSAMLHALVLAAEAFPVGDRAEDAGAEEAVALGLKSAVVNGFRLGHFSMRPAADFFRGRQADANGIEISHGICHIERARTKHVPPLSYGCTPPYAALENGR